MSLFDGIGIPKWLDPTERNVMLAKEGEGIASSFNQAYGQAKGKSGQKPTESFVNDLTGNAPLAGAPAGTTSGYDESGQAVSFAPGANPSQNAFYVNMNPWDMNWGE